MKKTSRGVTGDSLFLIILVGCFFSVSWFWPPALSFAIQMPGEPGLKVDCFQCHQELKQECAAGFAHWATANGKCTGCHNPHAAQFEYLLVEDGASLCYQCHQEQEQERGKKKYLHAPIQKEGCLGCHDAHVSTHRYHLKAEGQNLCFTCHERQGFQKQYVHKPVQDGNCRQCHTPHASEEDRLLTKPASQLCADCHNPGNLATAHQGFEVKLSNCIICHDPHASNNSGLVYDVMHKPYQEKNCQQCHQMERKPQIILIANGSQLCYTCHQNKREEFQGNSKTHLVSEKGECLYCHNPHAADRKDLVKKDDRSLCLGCHPEMEARLNQSGSFHRHPEVNKGNCSYCHDPHASSLPKFYQAEALLLCTKCHTRQKTACHPVGNKVIDPRDKKTPVKCDTCHDPMGTIFKHNLRLDGSQALCQQCHNW